MLFLPPRAGITLISNSLRALVSGMRVVISVVINNKCRDDDDDDDASAKMENLDGRSVAAPRD